MSLYDKLITKHGKLGTDVLRNGRFSAKLMRAERLTGGGEHGLPPGDPIMVFPVDSLPGAPSDWVKGSGSYACLVDINFGLWFDWTGNDPLNTAIVPSVKGMNPITGRKLDDVAMEQYKDKCPVHGSTFKDGLYCEECGYRWPPQNYVASPGILWFDGWRSSDGKVRQFVFTEDERRDIASIVMGKENTVPAFGFAFYEPKKRREPAPSSPSRNATMNYDIGSLVYYGKPEFYSPINMPSQWNMLPDTYGVTTDGALKGSVSISSSNLALDPKFLCSTSNSCRGLESKTSGMPDGKSSCSGHADDVEDGHADRENKDVSVGAGALIRQELAQDPLSCEDWKAEPSALIRLYFVFPEQFRDIAKAGIRDLNGKKDGFLAGMPVG